VPIRRGGRINANETNKETRKPPQLNGITKYKAGKRWVSLANERFHLNFLRKV
jgi:hypothetical protein